jgi:hypothetical protein
MGWGNDVGEGKNGRGAFGEPPGSSSDPGASPGAWQNGAGGRGMIAAICIETTAVVSGKFGDGSCHRKRREVDGAYERSCAKAAGETSQQ